jgi:hypothetical protein
MPKSFYHISFRLVEFVNSSCPSDDLFSSHLSVMLDSTVKDNSRQLDWWSEEEGRCWEIFTCSRGKKGG